MSITITPEYLLVEPVIETFVNSKGAKYKMVICNQTETQCWVPNGLEVGIQRMINRKPEGASMFWIGAAYQNEDGVYVQECSWLDADENDLF